MKIIEAVRGLFTDTDTDTIDQSKPTDMEVSRRINEARVASLTRQEEMSERSQVNRTLDDMLSDVSKQWKQNRIRHGLD